MPSISNPRLSLRQRRRLLALIAGSPLLPLSAPAAAQAWHAEDLDVPYVTTPQNVVDAMLDLAAIGANDVLLDLGSGDGRIVITAAQRFGTSGTGIEIDPRLVTRARANAQTAGVAGKVSFLEQDLYSTDLARASVITLYLLPAVNLKLRPALQRLKPGTRIVSHDWDMGDWQPDRTVVVAAPEKRIGLEKTSRLMLWIVR